MGFILYYMCVCVCVCVEIVNLHKIFLFWDNKYTILTKFIQVWNALNKLNNEHMTLIQYNL